MLRSDACVPRAPTGDLVLTFEFLVLTAARSGNVRGARWAEINRQCAVWTVPPDRMSAGREHRVPLSDRALAVLDQARELADGTDLVFPSETGRVPHQSGMPGCVRILLTGFTKYSLSSLLKVVARNQRCPNTRHQYRQRI